MNTEWIAQAVEQKHPRLSVAVADSIPYVVQQDKLDKLLGTRQFNVLDIAKEGLRK